MVKQVNETNAHTERLAVSAVGVVSNSLYYQSIIDWIGIAEVVGVFLFISSSLR